MAPARAMPYHAAEFYPTNFDLTKPADEVRYGDFCIAFMYHTRQGFAQESEIEAFIELLRHDLPRSLRLAQVHVPELRRSGQVDLHADDNSKFLATRLIATQRRALPKRQPRRLPHHHQRP